MAITEESIAAFYQHYGETLTSGKPDTIAACYIAPALIVLSGVAFPVVDLKKIEDDYTGSAERYAAMGLVGAVPEVVHVDHLSDVLANVDVHWDYVDADGVSQGEDGYRYLLRDVDGDLKIQVVISTPDRLRRGAA